MGGLFSRIFGKSVDYAQELEKLEVQIADQKKCLSSRRRTEKLVAGRVTKLFMLMLTCAVLFVLFKKCLNTERRYDWWWYIHPTFDMLWSVGVVLFFMVLRRALSSYYNWRIKRISADVSKLELKRSERLEEVKKNVPYEKASSILDKFDPAVIKKKNAERAEEEKRRKETALRQRKAVISHDPSHRPSPKHQPQRQQHQRSGAPPLVLPSIPGTAPKKPAVTNPPRSQADRRFVMPVPSVVQTVEAPSSTTAAKNGGFFDNVINALVGDDNSMFGVSKEDEGGELTVAVAVVGRKSEQVFPPVDGSDVTATLGGKRESSDDDDEPKELETAADRVEISEDDPTTKTNDSDDCVGANGGDVLSVDDAIDRGDNAGDDAIASDLSEGWQDDGNPNPSYESPDEAE